MEAASQLGQGSVVKIDDITQQDRGLAIRWADGDESFFHYIWLRDCCYCAVCGNCYDSNRALVPCDLSLDVRPREVRIDDCGDLEITWEPDCHHSHYGALWLHQHCYEDSARRGRRLKPILWDESLAHALPVLDYSATAADDMLLLKLYRNLRDYGLVIVTGGSREPGAVEQVANLIGDLGDAAYSKIFDLTPSSKVRTLGNSTRPVPPHTDEPFRYTPPGIMVLGCVRKADDGGDTVLVDGFNVAEKLRQENNSAFELLATIDQNFIRIHDGSLNQQTRTPMISLNGEGEIRGVRIHTRSSGPMDLPRDLVEPYYAAHHRLIQMTMAPKNQIRLTLEPGDCVLFDNHRVLHARTSFSDPQRFLQICNIPREIFHDRLRLLAEKMGYPEEARLVLPAGSA